MHPKVLLANVKSASLRILPQAHGWHAGDCVVPRYRALHSDGGLQFRLAASGACPPAAPPWEDDRRRPHAGDPQTGPARARFFVREGLSRVLRAGYSLYRRARIMKPTWSRQLSPWMQTGPRAVRKRTIVVNDKMQRGYRYALTVPTGRNFDPEFRPQLTPRRNASSWRVRRQIPDGLQSRVPAELVFARQAREEGRDCSLNYFGVDASQPLSVWRKKGWIHRDDPRGWFQWYCRYFLGRRSPDEDARQIRRWKAIRRHVRQIQRNCEPGDVTCRPRQRQALLHWAYDSRKI